MLEREIGLEMANGIVYGVVVAGGTLSSPLATRAFGYAEPGHSHRMREDSIIDLASVSKVLATTTALLIARDFYQLDFDRPFIDYLPQYQAALPQAISIRDLAMHISGFGAQRYYDAPSAEEIRRNLLTLPPPDSYGKFSYSCWNYHLLSLILEQVTQSPFEIFCQEQIFQPLAMHDTTLGKPRSEDPERLVQSCATEKAGQISDSIASRLYAAGFATGNAGAFSCAQDLTKFCRCLLQRGVTASGQPLFSEAGYQDISIARELSGGVRRSFGWVVADEHKPLGFSEKTIYHSGWSGQTIFLDFERQFYAIVLTTRALAEYDRAKAGCAKIISELAKECRIG